MANGIIMAEITDNTLKNNQYKPVGMAKVFEYGMLESPGLVSGLSNAKTGCAKRVMNIL